MLTRQEVRQGSTSARLPARRKCDAKDRLGNERSHAAAKSGGDGDAVRIAVLGALPPALSAASVWLTVRPTEKLMDILTGFIINVPSIILYVAVQEGGLLQSIPACSNQAIRCNKSSFKMCIIVCMCCYFFFAVDF